MAGSYPGLSAVVMCQACGATGRFSHCSHIPVWGRVPIQCLSNIHHALPVSCFCLWSPPDTPGWADLGLTWQACILSPHADRRSLTQPCASTMLGGQPPNMCANNPTGLGLVCTRPGLWGSGSTTWCTNPGNLPPMPWHQQAPGRPGRPAWCYMAMQDVAAAGSCYLAATCQPHQPLFKAAAGHKRNRAQSHWWYAHRVHMSPTCTTKPGAWSRPLHHCTGGLADLGTNPSLDSQSCTTAAALRVRIA
jgi:hypothetical protein